MRALHICTLFLLLSFVRSKELTVDEYVEAIKALKLNAITWKFPEDSRAYLKGRSEPIGDVFDGNYDFIILGGGSAGTVLANRLTEVKDWNILLIDAGTYENDITDIPGVVDYLRTTDYNWGYNAFPQPNGFGGYIDQAISIPRGKGIGGSSIINALIYTRGNRDDYDKWASLGCPGWSYADVLPYFKKSENAAFPNASKIYHGFGGPLNVEFSRIYDQVGEAFINANVELGRKVLDYNAEMQEGFSILQMNEIFGRRDSGGKAFIYPIRNRKNLHIITETLITKILIDEPTKTAYGVEYVRDGVKHHAKANKEVILALGTINTPQMLMLSGVGPKKHLEEKNIKVLKDAAVGQNLWDHLIYGYQSFAINYTYPSKDLRTLVLEYLQGKGDLTSPDNVQVIGYISVLDGTDTVPDVEYVVHTGTVGHTPYEVYRNFHRLTRDSYEYSVKPTEGKSQYKSNPILLHEKSRGEIRLKSNSPYDYPILDPKYFSHPDDAQTLVNALKDSVVLASTNSLKKYDATLIPVTHPHCKGLKFGSDEYWRCMVLNLADTVHHFGGTTKMGAADDSTAVVDPSLKVYGIKNLRVADCSIIPSTLSGHTGAPAHMIGEKAGDIIKSDHGIKIN